MRFLKILSGGIIGTVAMTAFSYAVSRLAKKQFREPVLLGILLGDDEVFDVDRKLSRRLLGWSLHTAVGIGFVASYDLLWRHSKMQPRLKDATVIGGVSGLFAVAVWHSVFRTHPRPPYLDYDGYYSQLFLAHIIFGIAAAEGYKLPEAENTLLIA